MKNASGFSRNQNIDQFNEDVHRQGCHTYRGHQPSPILETKRISLAIAINYNFIG